MRFLSLPRHVLGMLFALTGLLLTCIAAVLIHIGAWFADVEIEEI